MRYKCSEETIAMTDDSAEYRVEIDEKEKKKRRDKVNEALAYSTVGSPPPDKEVLDIYERYINGEIELDQIYGLVIEFCNERYNKMNGEK